MLAFHARKEAVIGVRPQLIFDIVSDLSRHNELAGPRRRHEQVVVAPTIPSGNPSTESGEHQVSGEFFNSNSPFARCALALSGIMAAPSRALGGGTSHVAHPSM